MNIPWHNHPARFGAAYAGRVLNIRRKK